MAKNSRFLESLVHDIPMYPFSSTPDGRIVAELHRGRRENKDFQEQSLAIQERAVERLIDIHKGAMAVPASDFRSSEAARILGDVAYEMQNVYAAQERSAQGIEALGQATSEGLDQVHEDLREIKGPTYPHEDLGELVESDQDFFAAMCAYSKGMLNQRAISQFHGVFTQKMKVRPSAIVAIETSLETNIREEQLRQIKETQRAQQKKGEKPAGPALPLPPLKSLKDFPEIREALKILKNPLLLLNKDRGATYQQLATLQQVAENYDVPLLKAAVDFFDSFFETYRKAQQTPLPQEMLIMLGKNHLLAPAVQHQAMKYFPETRDDASLTTVNYTLLDIARDTRAAIQQRKVLTAMGAASLKQQQGLYEQGEVAIQQRDIALGKMNTMIGQNETAREQRERGLYQGDVAIHQRDVTNYHLESIVGNLAKTRGEMVDFRGIVEDFAEMVEEGFEQVNSALEVGFGVIDQRLKVVQTEMVLTRTAVVSELRKIDESILYFSAGIIDSIERTNELLTELVDIARNSKQNEARQYFEDGSGCLKTAEEMDHIEEAYQRFCKGIDVHGMTVENHYGAALCAELLGRLEEAKKRYVTLIARCGEKKELKSQGQEGLARVEYKSGNLLEAVNQCKEAQNTNPKNFSAKFSQAQYLALQGLWDEVVKVLVSLFQERSEWYLRLKAKEVFSRFPELYHKKLLLELVDSKEMKGSPGKLSFLFDVMTLKMEDEAISLIMEKLETHPIEIMKNKPWKHPFFVKLKNKLFERIRSHLIENLDLLTAKTCYELTVVLSALGIEEKVLVAVLQQGVNGDPQMYQDDCDKMEILRKEISEINSLETKKIEPIFSKINFPKKKMKSQDY